MIPKGTNVVVNFYVTNADGMPISDATGITPYYRLNGGASSILNCAIESLDDAIGWYRFSTVSFNNSVGNLFITFSNDNNYVIMPWEDDIVQVGGATASDIWNHSFSDNTASTYLWNASTYAHSANTAAAGITVPTTSDIATSVWNYNLESDPLNPSRIVSSVLTSIPSSSDIGTLVWGSTFMEDVVDLEVEPNDVITERIWTYGGGGGQTHQYSTAFEILDATPTVNAIAGGVWRYDLSTATPAVPASTYLRSTYGLPSRVWSYSWGTPTAVSAYSYLTSIYNNTSSITIPTPPTTSAIATSVWAHTSRSITTTLVNDGATAGNETYIATGSNVSGIPSAVWTYNIGPNTTTASTYLGSIGAIPTTSSIATSVWTYSTTGNPSSDRSLTYYPAFPTVSSIQNGLATTSSITALWNSTKSSISAIQTHGDTSWKTATGFATASALTSVWSSTAGSISALQTHGDTSWKTATGFATSTSLGSVWTSVAGSISALQTHGDTSWKTATGFATTGNITTVWNSTAASISTLQAHGDTSWKTATGFATATYLSSVWDSTSTSISNLQTHGDQAWVGEGGGGLTASDVWTYTSRSLTTATLDTTNNPVLATSANITSLWNSTSASISALQTHGDTSWKTATGFATPTDITTKLTAYSAAKNTDITTLYNSISNSLDGGMSAADVWSYAINGSSASVYLGYISTISTSTSSIITSIGTINTSIGSVNTAIGSVNTDIGSINTRMSGIVNNIGVIGSSLDFNNAALLDWSLSTYSIIALKVNNQSYLYNVSRDLAGNITGITPSE